MLRANVRLHVVHKQTLRTRKQVRLSVMVTIIHLPFHINRLQRVPHLKGWGSHGFASRLVVISSQPTCGCGMMLELRAYSPKREVSWFS